MKRKTYTYSELGIGPRIRDRRAELKLSSAELASKANVEEGWLADIESEREQLPFNRIVPLADALEVSTDWLLGGDARGAKHPRALHQFLMTPAGRWTAQHGFVNALLQLPASMPPTVELYTRVASALRFAIESQPQPSEPNENT